MNDAELLAAVAKVIYDAPRPKRPGTERFQHMHAQALARSKAARIITLVRKAT